jgi:hypothetical protein
MEALENPSQAIDFINEMILPLAEMMTDSPDPGFLGYIYDYLVKRRNQWRTQNRMRKAELDVALNTFTTAFGTMIQEGLNPPQIDPPFIAPLRERYGIRPPPPRTVERFPEPAPRRVYGRGQPAWADPPQRPPTARVQPPPPARVQPPPKPPAPAHRLDRPEDIINIESPQDGIQYLTQNIPILRYELSKLTPHPTIERELFIQRWFGYLLLLQKHDTDFHGAARGDPDVERFHDLVVEFKGLIAPHVED